MEFFSGYDPFTKQVYVRAPRKAVYADAPTICIICHEHGDETLFANPCIGCACNIAVHASCWKQYGKDECATCRVRFRARFRVPTVPMDYDTWIWMSRPVGLCLLEGTVDIVEAVRLMSPSARAIGLGFVLFGLAFNFLLGFISGHFTHST